MKTKKQTLSVYVVLFATLTISTSFILPIPNITQTITHRHQKDNLKTLSHSKFFSEHNITHHDLVKMYEDIPDSRPLLHTIMRNTQRSSRQKHRLSCIYAGLIAGSTTCHTAGMTCAMIAPNISWILKTCAAAGYTAGCFAGISLANFVHELHDYKQHIDHKNELDIVQKLPQEYFHVKTKKDDNPLGSYTGYNHTTTEESPV